MGCFPRGDKSLSDVFPGVTNLCGMLIFVFSGVPIFVGCFLRSDKSLWDVFSGMTNLCGMFSPG